MNKTKVYLVIRSTLSYMSNIDQPIGAYLSLREAEFEAWRLGKAKSSNRGDSIYSYCSFLYKVKEVEIKTNSLNDKDYTKFLEERRKEIKELMAKSEACETKDKENIAELNKKLELYTPLEGNK